MRTCTSSAQLTLRSTVTATLVARTLLLACGGVLLVACGGPETPPPVTPPTKEGGSAGAGSTTVQVRPPERKDVELVYDVPTMVCRIECPKRIGLEANNRDRYPWANSVRVDPVKKRMTLRCTDPEHADLLAFERALRQLGYLVQLANRDKLPPALAKQVLTLPTEGAYGIEISNWRKMAGCSMRGSGPNPEQVIVAVRGVIESGYFEIDLAADKLRVVPSGGTPTPEQVIEAIETVGAKARKEGDVSNLPGTIRAALAKSNGKRIFVSFHAQGCAVCAKMKKTTLADEKVKAALEAFERVEVDVGADVPTATYYNVTATPAIVILDANGVTVRTLVGLRSVEEVLAGLE